ncbi:unnamed protein product [Darwinula stevensoni]|uniref:Uncharacterized protein n=1 Tax=Darwinula stevensoni TaxID=69355 RepID=A0A7R8ZZR6_9CRUS|nr:unnamed protein product [Darwinula stevensoni]CAG0884277.1 unnamed protein product [Darwinula stevensoni]
MGRLSPYPKPPLDTGTLQHQDDIHKFTTHPVPQKDQSSKKIDEDFSGFTHQIDSVNPPSTPFRSHAWSFYRPPTPKYVEFSSEFVRLRIKKLRVTELVQTTLEFRPKQPETRTAGGLPEGITKTPATVAYVQPPRNKQNKHRGSSLAGFQAKEEEDLHRTDSDENERSKVLESTNLHVLVATPTKVKQWAHLTKEANILFEVYGMLDSVPAGGHNTSKRFFLCDGNKTRLLCIFYEIDRPMKNFKLGDHIRCVGKLQSSYQLQCFSIRECRQDEAINIPAIVSHSQKWMNSLASVIKGQPYLDKGAKKACPQIPEIFGNGFYGHGDKSIVFSPSK